MNFGQNLELPILVIGFGFHGLAIPIGIKSFLQDHFFLNLRHNEIFFSLKFIFSKKATKMNKIFTIDLTFTTKGQIDREDFCQFLWPS